MMRVLFTGSGGGGHFYPIIAIAQKLNEQIEKEKLVNVELYYMADSVLDERLLFENNIKFKKNPTGKLRRYFAVQNFFDAFKTFGALFRAVGKVYSLYPDVVIGKGGYGSFPALFAARFFGIPVVIHESDTVPGKVNRWAGKFAQRIAVSYPSSVEFFPKDKTAYTGQPIRSEIMRPVFEGANMAFLLEPNVPVLLVLGGSQGAQLINDTLIQTLPDVLNRYQVIHQTGSENQAGVSQIANAILEQHPHKNRYHPIAFLDDTKLRLAAGVATLVLSRAGSTIFEIAAWGLPSIVIPITKSNGDHQRKNAFTYARSGACEVIEETNLGAHVLASEITRLMEDGAERARMSEAAKSFAKYDAAEKIAREIVNILLKHQ
jgi:UDP-N-acetylglucosamine--N-acetylmuramyl-(pentapeptide) pyrophosphoryl-undecaprenol N-acetylglucosamine transferase